MTPPDASYDGTAVDGTTTDGGPPVTFASVDDEPPVKEKKPLYPRLLRLRHVRPNAWQRAVLGEGALGVAVLLVLADLATAWTLLALPLAVAAVVKVHDLVAGLLARTPAVTEPADRSLAAEQPPGDGADAPTR